MLGRKDKEKIREIQNYARSWCTPKLSIEGMDEEREKEISTKTK
jgi:hypothetical protein